MPFSNYIPSSAISKPGVCTSTTRPASPYDGMVIYETDTDKTLVWNGSAWVYLSTSAAGDVGLVKVVPSGATNGTVGADGTVTIGSAVSTVTVTCFSASFANYKITLDNGDASADGADIRFSLAGITNGWYYNGYYMIAGSSTLSGINGSNQAFSVVTQSGTDHWNFSIDVFSPFATKRKFLTGGYGAQGTNTYVGNMHGVNNSTTSAASFTLAPSSGTITGGTIRVYGYKD